MPASYSTPGVYVEEISTFPPSVAEVSTAVPAFLGYTETGPMLRPTRLTTMREYESLFGGAPVMVKQVTLDDAGRITTAPTEKPALLPLRRAGHAGRHVAHRQGDSGEA